MSTSNDLNKNSLLIQTENYKTFLKSCPQLIEKDRLLKEHVSLRIWMLQSTFDELQTLEETNHQTEYEQSLDRANRLLQGLKALIEDMLNSNKPPNGSFQS